MSNVPNSTTQSPAAPSQPAGHVRPHVHHAEKPVNSVTYCGHTKLIFTWPLIALGFILYPLEGRVATLHTLGWVYIFVIVTVLLTIAVDLSRNYGVVWLLIVALILVLGRWLEDVKGITVLGDIYRWFAKRQVDYDAETGLVLSTIMSVFFVIGVLWAWANNRYTMTHNEVVQHVWGRGERSVGRGARIITIAYPDWFEFILCGAGTILVYDNTGRSLICKSEHVPFLFLRRRKIDKILESISVTPEDMAASDVSAATDVHDSGTDDLH